MRLLKVLALTALELLLAGILGFFCFIVSNAFGSGFGCSFFSFLCRQIFFAHFFSVIPMVIAFSRQSSITEDSFDRTVGIIALCFALVLCVLPVFLFDSSATLSDSDTAALVFWILCVFINMVIWGHIASASGVSVLKKRGLLIIEGSQASQKSEDRSDNREADPENEQRSQSPDAADLFSVASAEPIQEPEPPEAWDLFSDEPPKLTPEDTADVSAVLGVHKSGSHLHIKKKRPRAAITIIVVLLVVLVTLLGAFGGRYIERNFSLPSHYIEPYTTPQDVHINISSGIYVGHE